MNAHKIIDLPNQQLLSDSTHPSHFPFTALVLPHAALCPTTAKIPKNGPPHNFFMSKKNSFSVQVHFPSQLSQLVDFFQGLEAFPQLSLLPLIGSVASRKQAGQGQVEEDDEQQDD